MRLNIRVVAVTLSAALLFAGLWQLEIVYKCLVEGNRFDFPFYVLPSLNVWVARDLFYLFIVVSWFMLFMLLVQPKIRERRKRNADKPV